jgi:hypothetical protein
MRGVTRVDFPILAPLALLGNLGKTYCHLGRVKQPTSSGSCSPHAEYHLSGLEFTDGLCVAATPNHLPHSLDGGSQKKETDGGGMSGGPSR